MSNQLTPLCKKHLIKVVEDEKIARDNLQQVKTFEANLKKRVESAKKADESYSPPKTDLVIVQYRPMLRFLGNCCAQAQHRLYESINNLTTRAIYDNAVLLKYLHFNPTHSINADAYMKETLDGIKNDPNLKRFVWFKQALDKQIVNLVKKRNAGNAKKAIILQLNKLQEKYNDDEKYIPNSPLDQILVYYLHGHPQFAPMIPSIIEQIKSESDESLLITIDEMAQDIIEKLDPPQTIQRPTMMIYIALVRFFFAESYCEKPTLAMNWKNNLLFMKKCQILQNKTVQQMPFSQAVKQFGNLPLTRLFKEPILKIMNTIEFMTNPIDIIVRCHRARLAIMNAFPYANEKDYALLFTILIAVNPPMNAISIVLFLQKWGDFSLTDELEKSKNMYIYCAKQIAQLPDEDE